ncbi:MAG: hypothetical protein E4G95_00320 [Bacteroidia bacterium]|nr:MAG: hypothetical protein E4G95_00320 [Bacteroidia bacterium]
MRIFRPPLLFRLLYPGAIFRYNAHTNRIYLTFDDGPAAGVTREIANVLENEGIKATFFCCGKAAEEYPELTDLIRRAGFGLGNHGYHHVKGWETSLTKYVENTNKGADITGSHLFRPPFGSLTPRQFFRLRKDHRVVFWDLMLYDFDPEFDRSKILAILKRRIRPGSVIVLHDNKLSSSPEILADIIRTIKDMGYTFGELVKDAWPTS